VYRVVTNLCVLDFATPDGSMRLVSTHPGVTVDEVLDNTGFPLDIGEAAQTREPSAHELELIDKLDPDHARD
jgi:acyl CoA:acetate/3-ketoacid CoA transferase beta subunit